MKTEETFSEVDINDSDEKIYSVGLLIDKSVYVKVSHDAVPFCKVVVLGFWNQYSTGKWVCH